ncbi:MAG TPA: HlyD family efflux transporter periplasmic adaptor subunit, partial [Spirochaetia bacterium]|nr:HlyD family efflux transporter periplasmic adaptor subunit [Spirochaetia bacterium]
SLRVAENTYRSAEEDYTRMAALFETGSVTRKQFDDAQAARSNAKARLDAARQNLAKIRNLSRPEEVRAALLKRDLARIAVDLAEEQLGYTTITAPLTGVVTHRLVETGELVFQGSALFSLNDLSTVDLTIYVTEVNLARVRIGQTARVTIDAYPQQSFTGKVVYISPEAEFTPKNVQTKEDRVKLVFAVKITIPNPDETLKPGMPADAELLSGKESR